MPSEAPQTVICRYVVKPRKETEMESLLAKHWKVLHEVGLVTDKPAQMFRGRPSGKPGGQHGAARSYVEIFEWKNGDTPRIAHQTPEVMAVWEPMGAICEDMDFPRFDPVSL